MENKTEESKALFEPKVAAENFERLAKEYFEGNFGKMRKADVELFMFSAYFDMLIGKMTARFNAETTAEAKDKVVKDFMKETSDTALSIKLGTIPSTIRGLKRKKILKDSTDGKKAYDWRVFFNQIKKNITCIENEGMVRISIPDAMLLQEISNYLESNEGFVELEITPTLIKVTPEDFIKLVIETECNAEGLAQLNAKLKKYAEGHGKAFQKLTTPDSAYDTVVGYLTSTEAEAVLDFLGLFPGLGIAEKVGKTIMSVLRERNKK